MKIFGVIPAYNEGERLAGTVEICLPYVDHLVVVDDGSTDKNFVAPPSNNKVTFLRHCINRGQGAALRTGTEAALKLGADIIVHLDADGQHDPSDIAVLIDPIKNNEADIVFGSRFMGIEPAGMPFKRRLLIRGIRFFNLWVLGIPKSLTDPQSGLRAMNARAARLIQFNQDRMAHASEILQLVTRSTLRWKEVPAHVRYTQESLSKGQKSLDALKVTWQFIIGAFTK